MYGMESDNNNDDVHVKTLRLINENIFHLKLSEYIKSSNFRDYADKVERRGRESGSEIWHLDFTFPLADATFISC